VQPLFVFCADLHLEDGAWASKSAIYGDAYYSFDQIIEYCIAHKLPLILGGDVLERKQNLARPITKLCRGLSRMQHAQLNVYYIQGNHEYDRNAPWLSIHPWPIHLHDTGVFFGPQNDINVYGLDWLPRGEIQEAFKTLVPEDTDILVTHQVWKDFMGNVGRTECELTEVHHVQVVLAGDFHVTKVAESVNAQGQPIRMLSPGSTAMQDMGEDPHKSFFVICEHEGQIVFAPKKLKTRGAKTYVVKDIETLDALCAGGFAKDIERMVFDAQAGGHHLDVQKPLVKVKFDKQLPDAFMRVTTAIGESAHLFCEAIADKFTSRTNTTRDSVKNDLLDALSDLLDGNVDAYNLAETLLKSEDPNKDCETHFRQFVKEEQVDATVETGSEKLGAPPPADV
jgi:hypothetical protein